MLSESYFALKEANGKIFTICLLLWTFENSLDPDQAQQNVRPDLDPNCKTFWEFSWNIFLKNK